MTVRNRRFLAASGVAVALLLAALIIAGRQPGDMPGSVVYIGQDTSGVDQVYLLNQRDGQLRRLTTGPVTKASPRWSPDGRTIAFVDLYDKITVMLADGTAPHSFDAPGVVSLTWSPDGKQLVYESSTQGGALGSMQFHLVDVDGSSDHVIGPSGQSPAWSPDGSWLAYSGPDGAIWKSHVDGTGARQLTRPKGGQQDDQPRWSPDGGTLTFTRDGGIYTIPSGGGPVHLVFADPGANAGSPSYADARTLLFDQCASTGAAAVGGIYRIGVDGRGLSLVTGAHYGCSSASADWSASGG